MTVDQSDTKPSAIDRINLDSVGIAARSLVLVADEFFCPDDRYRARLAVMVLARQIGVTQPVPDLTLDSGKPRRRADGWPDDRDPPPKAQHLCDLLQSIQQFAFATQEALVDANRETAVNLIAAKSNSTTGSVEFLIRRILELRPPGDYKGIMT